MEIVITVQPLQVSSLKFKGMTWLGQGLSDESSLEILSCLDTRCVWLLAPGRRHLVLHWEAFMSALHGSCKEGTHPEMVEARGGTCFGCVPSSVLVLFWEYEDDE